MKRPSTWFGSILVTKIAPVKCTSAAKYICHLCPPRGAHSPHPTASLLRRFHSRVTRNLSASTEHSYLWSGCCMDWTPIALARSSSGMASVFAFVSLPRHTCSARNRFRHLSISCVTFCRHRNHELGSLLMEAPSRFENFNVIRDSSAQHGFKWWNIRYVLLPC